MQVSGEAWKSHGSTTGNMGWAEILIMKVEEAEDVVEICWKSLRSHFPPLILHLCVCALLFLLGRAESGQGLVLASLHKGPHPTDRSKFLKALL